MRNIWTPNVSELKMVNFIKKHAPNLPGVLLVLMLVVPFLLYYFARSGSRGGVIFFLAMMVGIMLAAMKP
jgi:hypothetical protein